MNCNGFFGRLFGHNYEPRYSRSEPTCKFSWGEGLVFANEIVAIMDASKRVTYHFDICCRCGHLVKTQEPA